MKKHNWLTGLRRTPYQTLAAVVIVTASLFVATAYFLSVMTAQRILSSLESRPQVIAFIKDDAGEEAITKLKGTITDTVKIKEIRFLSKDDALNRYRLQNAKDPLLLELVTASILPASLEVSTVNASDLEVAAKIMKESSAVEDVAFQKEETKDFISWINSVRLSGTVIVGLLSFTAVMVLLVVFALKISLRREEIEVLQLVGASSWQVRSPFLYEGLFYGFLAGVFSAVASYIFIIHLKINPLGVIPALVDFSVPFTLTPINLLLWFLAEIVVGMVIGFIGSFLAVWRYLRK